MKIVAHNKFRDPISEIATSVVIYDDHDQPIALFLDQGNGMILASTVKDKNRFYLALRNFGVPMRPVQISQEDTPNVPTFEPGD